MMIEPETLGKVAMLASLSGFTLQTATAWASMTALVINILLGAMGMYFMWRNNIRHGKRRNRRDTDG